MIAHVTGIEWDTDGEPHNLPAEAIVHVDTDADPDTGIADALSDFYGVSIKSFAGMSVGEKVILPVK